jgi:C1A family cysteine protease
MIKFIAALVLIAPAYAGSLRVVSAVYSFQDSEEYQAILTQLKTHGDFSEKSVTEQKSPGPKKMARGEQIVEEAKARNRAILADQKKREKSFEKTQALDSDLDRLKKEDQLTRDGWKKEVLEQRKQWQKEQEIFLGRLKVYQENTFVIPAPVEKIIEKKIINKLPEAFIVNQAFSVPVRDQFSRPTCSAFAGIRSLEIILAQNKISKDLSEQYFYWASKPNCHQSPCSEKGSWVNNAYRFSQKQAQLDIPLETNCTYATEAMAKNETQLPLPHACRQGEVKVEAYEEVKTLADVIEKIKNNVPVIMAAKLSENFYKNQGLITLTDAQNSTGAKLDAHSLGHAFLAIGLIELPLKLRSTEGQYCLVIANSWGKGWGAGGYGCLTENWLMRYRQPSAFSAVTMVSVR